MCLLLVHLVFVFYRTLYVKNYSKSRLIDKKLLLTGSSIVVYENVRGFKQLVCR